MVVLSRLLFTDCKVRTEGIDQNKYHTLDFKHRMLGVFDSCYEIV